MKIFKKKILKSFSEILDRILALMTMPVAQKVTMVAALILCATVNAMAAGEGAAGFASATTEIKSYQSQVSLLMKAIGAILAIVGAFTVFFKMQNGDQDVKKTIMMTIGGCVAFVALSEALPMFFGE